MDFLSKIRVIEDFPVPGVSFKDITTLLKDGEAYRAVIDVMAADLRKKAVELIIGPEARGFTIGCPLAYALGIGFVPVRKSGKLPGPVFRYEYDLEYGTDVLEVHKDAVRQGQRVAIVDDLLATGGTALACAKLIESIGGSIACVRFLIELVDLNGRDKLTDYDVDVLMKC